MSDQQINLYQDRFKQKRLWLSAFQVTALTVILVFAASVWSFLIANDLSATRQQNIAAKASKERLANELTLANAELAKLLKDDRIDQQISSIAQKIGARKNVLNFVDFNQFGSGQGFSDYLLALSRLHVSDIWLNRIKINAAFVQIKGSSLSADKVPGYFDRFSEEAVFKGKRFDVFELSRNESTEWKVDFEIATSNVGDEK